MISRVSKRHEITFCYPSRRENIVRETFFRGKLHTHTRCARYTGKLKLLWLKCSALHENYVTVTPNAKCRITINAIILPICEISWIFNVYILFPFFFFFFLMRVFTYTRIQDAKRIFISFLAMMIHRWRMYQLGKNPILVRNIPNLIVKSWNFFRLFIHFRVDDWCITFTFICFCPNAKRPRYVSVVNSWTALLK